MTNICEKFAKSKFWGTKHPQKEQNSSQSDFCNPCRFKKPMYVSEIIAQNYGINYQEPNLIAFIASRIEQIRNIRKYYEKLKSIT